MSYACLSATVCRRESHSSVQHAIRRAGCARTHHGTFGNPQCFLNSRPELIRMVLPSPECLVSCVFWDISSTIYTTNKKVNFVFRQEIAKTWFTFKYVINIYTRQDSKQMDKSTCFTFIIIYYYIKLQNVNSIALFRRSMHLTRISLHKIIL